MTTRYDIALGKKRPKPAYITGEEYARGLRPEPRFHHRDGGTLGMECPIAMDDHAMRGYPEAEGNNVNQLVRRCRDEMEYQLRREAESRGWPERLEIRWEIYRDDSRMQWILRGVMECPAGYTTTEPVSGAEMVRRRLEDAQQYMRAMRLVNPEVSMVEWPEPERIQTTVGADGQTYRYLTH